MEVIFRAGVFRIIRSSGGALAAGLVLAGCATAPLSKPDAAHLVSEKGIGPVKLGMTMAEIGKALGPGYEIVNPAQAAAGYRVRDANGREVFRFWVNSSEKSDQVIRVRTVRSEFRTVEGFGPGFPVAAVAGKWGAPLFRRDAAQGGREQVSFAHQPRFVLLEAKASGGDAGIYPRKRFGMASPEEFTKEFWPESKVFAVTVVLAKTLPRRTRNANNASSAQRSAAATAPASAEPPTSVKPVPSRVTLPDPWPTPPPTMRTRVSAE